MRIKRFVAATMREALAQVREDQGADAVIISNRRIDAGIELITAIDYDESLIAEALRQVRPTEAPPMAAAMPAAAPAPVAAPVYAEVAADVAQQAAPQSAPARPAAAPKVVWSQDPGVLALRQEVTLLRELLERQLSTLAWSDLLRRDPLRGRVLSDLAALDIESSLARSIAAEMPPIASGADASRIPLALLVRRIPVIDDGLLERGGVIAVVGPTGVGKTTTIAKLAARFALRHGARQVALVSTDHYRIGARDQLLTYARILGVPMQVASNARELAGVLNSLADRKLILIDTAGMSPRDLRLPEQMKTLAAAGDRVRTLLTLAANCEYGALDQTLRAYQQLRPVAAVLTKLDEAASLGAALSVVATHRLPLAHLCNGQRVPEDLHAAVPKRIWLVKQAVKLSRRAPKRADDGYLATQFGEVARHG